MKEVEWFSQLCSDIKTLKIQGAERVARAAVEGLSQYMKETGREPPGLLVDRLLRTRPTEPMMHNAVRFFLRHAKPQTHETVLRHIIRHFDETDERIARYAGGLIREGGVYFTHCHSSTVVHSLIASRQRGVKFDVHNTETRPRLQGRITAQELAAAGIPVVHFIDSAARVGLKGCAAVFLGADALLADGKVVNKIGSEMVAELAFNRDIPVYVLTNSWKYDPATAKGYKELLERRSAAEVWPDPPKGVLVQNDAFELIQPRYITAVITEHGIRDPVSAVAEIRKRSSLIDDKQG